MMRITLNGEPCETKVRTLAALFEAATEALAPPSRRGFAIALNGEVVRAARWDETELKDDDRIDIIRAMAGG